MGGEAPVTPISSLDSSYLNLSYKPCNNKRLIHSFVHLESFRGSIEKRMEALDEGSLGAYFHGGFDPQLFVVSVLALRRAHSWRRVQA